MKELQTAMLVFLLGIVLGASVTLTMLDKPVPNIEKIGIIE
jgi:hypothetical protein